MNKPFTVQSPANHGYAFECTLENYAFYTPHEREQINRIEWWCREQFGASFIYHGACLGRWTLVEDRFWFRDQIDATAFKLRWC